MDIHLIRHPKTVAPDGTCYGSYDIEPDPAILASDAARILPALPADARFLSSPQTRAHQLAQALAGRTVETDARLVEMDFGAWENRLWGDLPRSEIDAWAADTLGYTPPGGESVADMNARVLDWWSGLTVEDTPLVVVSHGGPLRLLAAHASGAGPINAMRFEVQWGSRAVINHTGDRTILTGWNMR